MPTDPKAIGFIDFHSLQVFISVVKINKRGEESADVNIVHKFHCFISTHIQCLLKQHTFPNYSVY